MDLAGEGLLPMAYPSLSSSFVVGFGDQVLETEILRYGCAYSTLQCTVECAGGCILYSVQYSVQ